MEWIELEWANTVDCSTDRPDYIAYMGTSREQPASYQLLKLSVRSKRVNQIAN